jgi:tRNA ligase
MRPPVRLLALNWSLDRPLSEIHRTLADRILARGTNHQTLHGDPTGAKSHENVLWQFLRLSEPLSDDGEADATIEMDVSEDLEQSLARAIDGIVRVLALPRPDMERVGMALAKARAYKPAPAPSLSDTKHPKQAKQASATKTPPTPRYFALLAEIDLVDALDAHISLAASPLRDFWDTLKGSPDGGHSGSGSGGDCRIARTPHVTIVHSKQLQQPDRDPTSAALWERCVGLHALHAPPLFRARLGHLVANGRIMAATVEDLCVDDPEEDAGQEGATFVSQLDPGLCERLHITIGTKDASVPAVEAGALVQAFKGGETGIENVPLEGVYVKGRIKRRMG